MNRQGMIFDGDGSTCHKHFEAHHKVEENRPARKAPTNLYTELTFLYPCSAWGISVQCNIVVSMKLKTADDKSSVLRFCFEGNQ